MGQKVQLDQLVIDEPKRNLGTVTRQRLDTLIDILDENADYPGKIFYENVSGADAILRITESPLSKIKGDTQSTTTSADNETIASVGNVFYSYPLSHINLATGSTSGSIDVGTPPTTTNNYWRWLLFTAKDSAGQYQLNWGDQVSGMPSYGSNMPVKPTGHIELCSLRVQNSGGSTWNFLRPAITDFFGHTRGGGGGSSSGSGGINYITGSSSDFESSIGSWVVVKNTTPSAIPEVSPGGTISGNITFTRTTSNPIFGVASGLITKAGSANTQGETIKVPFTMPRGGFADSQLVQFYIETDSNYVDESLVAYIIDATNGTVIQPVPYLIKKSGLIERFFTEFQASLTGTSYYLAIHCASTTTTNFTVKVDMFSVGPKMSTQNTVITDPAGYTPTFGGGFGTTSSVKFTSTRMGKYLKIIGTFATGTTSAGEASFTLPTGLTLSSDISAVYYNNLGAVTVEPLNVANHQITVIGFAGANKIYFGEQTNNTGLNPITTTASTFFFSGSRVSMEIMVPITGWSAGTEIADIYTGRDIVTTVITAAGQTVTPNTFTKLTLGTVIIDTIGAFDDANDRIYIKSSGRYKVRTDCYATPVNAAATNVMQLHLYKNGVTIVTQIRANYQYSSTPTSFVEVQLSREYELDLVAGDYLEIFGWQNLIGSTVNATYTNKELSVVKIQAPNQVLAGEKIVELFNSGVSSQTIDNTLPIILFGTKELSTHGAYNGSTGVFTAPRSGVVTVYAQFLCQVNLTTAQNLNLWIYKNGTGVKFGSVAGTGASSYLHPNSLCYIPVVQGDTIDIRGFSVVSTSLQASAYYNYVSFFME
jgi:hypothetical protein